MSVTAAAETIYILSKEDLIPYDLNDQCMRVFFASFEILGQMGDPFGGPRIEFQLRPFTKPIMFINHLGKTGLPPANFDHEGLVMQLAVESVLKHLKNAGCVGKDQMSFQYRRGNTITHDNPSKIFLIPLAPNVSTIFNGNAFLDMLGQGIISRTYAYLNQRKVCFFLNDNQPATLAKIHAVLNPLFFPNAV